MLKGDRRIRFCSKSKSCYVVLSTSRTKSNPNANPPSRPNILVAFSTCYIAPSITTPFHEQENSDRKPLAPSSTMGCFVSCFKPCCPCLHTKTNKEPKTWWKVSFRISYFLGLINVLLFRTIYGSVLLSLILYRSIAEFAEKVQQQRQNAENGNAPPRLDGRMPLPFSAPYTPDDPMPLQVFGVVKHYVEKYHICLLLLVICKVAAYCWAGRLLVERKLAQRKVFMLVYLLCDADATPK